MAGLRWADVDLRSGVIRVQVQRTMEGYKVVEREPKTAAGRRQVPVVIIGRTFSSRRPDDLA